MNFHTPDYHDHIDTDQADNQARLFSPSPLSTQPLTTYSNSNIERSNLRSNTSLLHERELQGGESAHIHVNEGASSTGKFPYSLIMKVANSEPRDVLQSERTCLTFIRFSTSLFFTALGVILNFQLNTSSEPNDPNKKLPGFNKSLFSKIISFLLIILSFSTLLISGINYMITINRYANHKIHTYSFNNLATVICITSVIITLIVISISLIIERYIQEA